MKKISLIFIFCCSFINFSLAQERFGRIVLDANTGDLIINATVSLLEEKEGATPLLKTTNERAVFFFTDLNAGNYRLRITAIGYLPYEQSFKLPFSEAPDRIIRLSKDTSILGAVTVISSGPPVTQKQDTTQFAAAQYKVNPDATTEDLIKKMPGISVDRSGNVTAQGEQVRKVTVDGKDFFGDDATAALRNIPASAVDKIQLFDRLSEQAQLTGVSDGNEQKAINIITKAGIQNAQFGRIYAGVGTDNRYAGGGNTSFFKNDRRISLVANFNNINQQNFGSQDMLGINGGNNNNSRGGGMGGGGSFRGPGMGGPAESFNVDAAAGISKTNAFGINYGDKWGKRFSVTGSWFFNNSENNNQSESNNLLFERKQTTLRNSAAITQNTNHRFNARIEFKPDSFNQFTFIPSFNWQKSSARNNSRLSSYLNTADSLFQSNSQSVNERSGYTIKQSLQYRHNFAKKGRNVSTSFNTTFTKNSGDANISGLYRFYDINGFPVFPDSVQDQLTDQLTNGQTWGGSLSYNEPLGKKGLSSLQFEYNPSLQINQANQQTFQQNTGIKSYDSSLSNEFDNQVMTHNGGVSYRYNPSKDEQFGVTLNAQQTQLNSDRILPIPAQVDQRFQNLLPFAFWRKKISKYSNVRIFFRTSITVPTINQLQDVITLTNPQSVNSGNKELVQTYSRFMGGRYNYTNTKTNRSLFVGVFFQHADDYISNATYIASSDSLIQQDVVLRKGAQLIKPVNLNGYQSLRTNMSYSIPVKALKTTINLNGTVLYSNLPGQINQIITKTQSWQYNLGLNLVSNISEYIDYNISYTANINRAQTKGLVVTPNNYVNHVAGVSFNLLSKKGWFMQHDLTYQVFRGLSASFDREFTLWSPSVGKKFFKSKAGELKITVFDLLKQNQSLSRTLTNINLEDSRSVVLSQYFLLTFSYNLKNFGKPKNNPEQTEQYRH
jgi:hypothetical protein